MARPNGYLYSSLLGWPLIPLSCLEGSSRSTDGLIITSHCTVTNVHYKISFLLHFGVNKLFQLLLIHEQDFSSNRCIAKIIKPRKQTLKKRNILISVGELNCKKGTRHSRTWFRQNLLKSAFDGPRCPNGSEPRIASLPLSITNGRA